jgi:Flp pilus assembly protein TadB
VLAVAGVATFAVALCIGSSGRLAHARATGRDTLRQRPTLPVNSDSRQSVGGSAVENPRRRLGLCIAVGAAVGCLLGGWAWAAGGVLAGIAFSWWTGRLESPSQARAREEIARDLPLAADLLAACVSVGRPVDEALRLVSRAVGGALGARLDAVLARLSLGADPLSEWRRATVDAPLAPLARTLVRTLESGAPIAGSLSRLAEDRRRERRTQTQLRARNVGVKAAGPLAACFLPAFMLIGIVPTVAGAFSDLVL